MFVGFTGLGDWAGRVGLVMMATPAFFIRRSGVVATLFRRKLSVLRLEGPRAPTVCSRQLLALVPTGCRGHVVARRRFCLRRRFDLVKVRLGAHGPGRPRSCSNRVDYAYRSLSRIRGGGRFCSCLFLDPVCGYVAGSKIASNFATRRLQRTKGDGIVSDEIVTLKNVAPSGVLRVGSCKFNNTIMVNSL